MKLKARQLIYILTMLFLILTTTGIHAEDIVPTSQLPGNAVTPTSGGGAVQVGPSGTGLRPINPGLASQAKMPWYKCVRAGEWMKINPGSLILDILGPFTLDPTSQYIVNVKACYQNGLPLPPMPES